MSKQFLIAVDSRGQIANWHVIRHQAWWNDSPIVLCSEKTPKEYLADLRKEKVDYIVRGEDKVDLRAALETVAELYGISRIRVDSGGILGGALLREKLIDEVSILYSPQLTGGTSARTIFSAADLVSYKGVIELQLMNVEVKDGQYVWATYKVKK